MGLSLDDTLLLPLCELLDLIAVHQIKCEGFTYRKPMSNRDELMSILRLE